MMKSQNSRIRFCNAVCALLALCLVILQFTPFWHFGNESWSINGYVWLACNDPEIENGFITQLGSVPDMNSVVITSILVLLLGAAGVVVCIVKSDMAFAALLPAAAGLSALYAFAFKPVFRLGSTWVIQLILSAAMLIFAAMNLVFGQKKNGSTEPGRKELSQDEINARVAAIKALGNTESKKGKKGGAADNESNFNRLLACLTDEVPECRAAAAEVLGATSRDAAFTHIVYLLDSEKDEQVSQVMRKALISIRENEKLEHAEKA